MRAKELKNQIEGEKKFNSFVHKEFLHILRDRRTSLILLVMPVMLILLFGFAISVEVRGIHIAIVAPEQTETVRQITEKINANEYFKVTKIYRTPQEAKDQMRKGNVDMVLRFPLGFEHDLAKGHGTAQMLIDASNPNNAQSEELYLKQLVASSLSKGGGSTPLANSRLLYNPRMESAYNFVPGLLGMILMIICAMMTSVSIVRENETGTMEVLLVSPVRPITIIIAKMIPYFTVSCIALASVLLISRFVLGVPLAGNIFMICFVSLIYLVLSLSLGLMISTLVRTQIAAMICSAMLLLLPVIMLSGMVFPIESQPAFFRGLSMIVPARWYISAMRKLMVEGLPITQALKELGVLAGMAISLLGIALANFKNRLS